MADPVADTRAAVVRVGFEVAKAKRNSPEPTNLAKGFEAAGLATESVGTGPAAKVQRVMSVDALRGFTIFWILGGDGLAWSLQEMTVGQGLSSPAMSAG